jgi:hypothetical protein
VLAATGGCRVGPGLAARASGASTATAATTAAVRQRPCVGLPIQTFQHSVPKPERRRVASLTAGHRQLLLA